jgi:hypothetical protein
MKKTEIILIILAILGLILKYNLITGGNILVIFPIFLLTMLYFSLGFALFNNVGLRQIFKGNAFKNSPPSNIVIAIILSIGISFLCFGILFQLQYWPGSLIVIYGGLFFSVPTLLFIIIKFIIQKKDFFLTNMIRTACYTLIGIIFINVSNLDLVKIQYRNHPKYIEAFAAYDRNREDSTTWGKLDIERNRANMSKEEFERYEKSKQ